MRLFQLSLLAFLLIVGPGLSAVPRLPAELQDVAIVVGLIAACAAVLHGAWWAWSLRSMTDSPLAACSWITGWLLWPLWIHGMSERKDSYRLFAEYPAEAVSPGKWAYYLWMETSLVGFWLAVGVCIAGTLAILVRGVRERVVHREQVFVVLSVMVFWGLLGRSAVHAVSWIVD